MKKYFVLALLFVTQYGQLTAQVPKPEQIYEWFSAQHDTLPLLHLTADFKAIQKAEKDGPWLDATLRINDTLEMPIRVKPRGNMRRRTCHIPPLKLKFAQEGTPDSLDELTEIKVVNQCHSGEDYETLVLKEYLCYKLYNIITDYSFNVQLVRLQFQQEGKKKPSKPNYAFVIEPIQSLGIRMGGRAYNPSYVSSTRLDTAALDKMAMFQFMIGNTDWQISTKHNLKLVAAQEKLPVIIPYDFDFSALVDAPYSAPRHDLPLTSVYQRWYMGQCRTDQQWQELLDFYTSRESELLACIDEFPYLSKFNKAGMTNYLLAFFKNISEPESVFKKIRQQCGSDY